MLLNPCILELLVEFAGSDLYGHRGMRRISSDGEQNGFHKVSDLFTHLRLSGCAATRPTSAPSHKCVSARVQELLLSLGLACGGFCGEIASRKASMAMLPS